MKKLAAALLLLRTLAFVAVAAGLAYAQSAPSETSATTTALAHELAYLGAQIADLERSLPNITCEEKAVSQVLHGSKVHKRVDFTATVNTKRDANGKLKESYVLTTVDGRPFTGQKVSIPPLCLRRLWQRHQLLFLQIAGLLQLHPLTWPHRLRVRAKPIRPARLRSRSQGLCIA